MKCRYDHCNNLGECSDDFVKVGNCYYCRECYEEKEMKVTIRETIKQMLPNETIRSINIVVSDLVHKRGYPVGYVLHVLKNIKDEKKVLNYARGIQYYCNNVELRNKYEKMIANKKYKEMVKEEPVKEARPVEILKFNTGATKETIDDLI